MQGRVWEFKDFRYTVWATSGQATAEFKTDLPGGAMAVRKTIIFPQSTERRTDQTPIDGIEARQFQFKFIPNGSGFLRVYKASVLVRAIGVHLDGGKSDFYETQPIALGG